MQTDTQTPLTRADVENGYFYILGRLPESEGAVAYHLDRFQSPLELRRHLLGTDEFLNGFAHLRGEADEWGRDPAAEKLALLHIPKTGGTSLVRMLESHFAAGSIFPDHYKIGAHPAYQLARYRFFHGHYRLRDLKFLPGKVRIATLLREPRARLISQYNFHRSKRIDPASPSLLVERARLGLGDYLRDPEVRRHTSVDNMQTRQLFYLSDPEMRRHGVDPAGSRNIYFGLPGQMILDVAMANLRQLEWVGVTERLDAFARLLFADLGLPPPTATPREMVTRQLAETAPDDYERTDPVAPNREEEQLLDELVELDAELYRLAGELFESRLRVQRRGNWLQRIWRAWRR
jgi:hypothetical protein